MKTIYQTLDYFLECVEEEVEEKKEIYGIDDNTVRDEIAFITSKDMDAITSEASRPATAFTSPFLCESIEQVSDWFINNIRFIKTFSDFSFLIMDSRTVEDNTCLLMCTLGQKIQTLRCDFTSDKIPDIHNWVRERRVSWCGNRRGHDEGEIWFSSWRSVVCGKLKTMDLEEWKVQCVFESVILKCTLIERESKLGVIARSGKKIAIPLCFFEKDRYSPSAPHMIAA